MPRKICIACKRRLSTASFNSSAKAVDGLAATCRACVNDRRRQLDRSRDRSPPGESLPTALRKGDLAAVRKWLRAGMPLHWGAVCETMRAGHLCVAELLLKSGLKQNVFTMAAIADAPGLARRLRRVPTDARLSERMGPVSDRVTPLHVACASDWSPHGMYRMADQVRGAELLVGHGADLKAVARFGGIDGVDPLLCACWTSRSARLTGWLLDRGAQSTETHLWAALGHLQRHGRAAYDIAQSLLDRGVPIDGTGGGTRTALHAFANQGSHQTAAWLISRGADVHARGPSGRTAAHFAAERNTGPKTLALLVENGADLSARDDDGNTPLDVAKRNAKLRVVAWIARRHGNTRASK